MATTILTPTKPAVPAIVQAAPQAAQTATLNLSADLATMLETQRLNTLTAATPPAPRFATIAAMIEAELRRPGGFYSKALRTFPPPSVQLTIATAKTAQAAAQAAQTAVVAEGNAVLLSI